MSPQLQHVLSLVYTVAGSGSASSQFSCRVYAEGQPCWQLWPYVTLQGRSSLPCLYPTIQGWASIPFKVPKEDLLSQEVIYAKEHLVPTQAPQWLKA